MTKKILKTRTNAFVANKEIRELQVNIPVKTKRIGKVTFRICPFCGAKMHLQSVICSECRTMKRLWNAHLKRMKLIEKELGLKFPVSPNPITMYDLYRAKGLIDF